MDDEPDVRDFVCMILSEAGCVVDSAGDGLEALGRIEVRRPDLLILDLMMPRMDGWGVLARLRGTGPPPVVVILSAFAERDRALGAGAAGCLAKPFRVQDLLDACESALDSGASA